MEFRSLFILWALLISNFAMAQNEKVERMFLWPYDLPAGKETGPARVQVTGVYYFTADNAGEKKSVSLHFRDIKIKFEHPFEYKYKGKYYTYMNLNAADGLATEGFNEIDITSIVLHFPPIGGLTVTDSKRPIVWISGGEGNAVDIAKCDKGKDLRTLTIGEAGSFATDMNWFNSTKLLARIERIFKKSADKEEYKMVIKDADNAFKNSSLPEAKQLYKKALALFPNEAYPAAQLAAIEKSLQNKQLKEKQDSEKEKAKSNNQQSSQNTAKGKTTPGNKTADDDFWSDKKTSSAGDTNLPDIAMSKDGKYYRKGANDKYEEIGQDDYYRLKKQKGEEKATLTAAEQKAKKEADLKAVDNMMVKIKKDQEDNANIYKEIDRRAGLQRQGYAAVGAREEARQNVKDISTLSGNYQSVEQLMADFNQKMSQLNNAVSDLTAKKNQALYSSADATFGTSSETAAYGEGIKLFGAMVNQAKEAKERKKAQEELKAQKEYMLNTMIAEEKRLLTAMRTDLFSRFKEGALPLSSTKLDAATIYYFVYAYNPAELGNKGAQLYISNVFPVSRYSDGTWPFKTSLTSDIAKLTPLSEIMHGYYTSMQEAEGMQVAMANVFRKTGGSIVPLSYKGKKPASSTGTGTKGDFWETGKKPVEPSSSDKKPAKKDDFWNN